MEVLAAILSARIQELYGIEGKFAVGHGRVPVKFEILAPNQRPIQVTDDLTAFWRDMYPKVKAELSRRYPRHEWRYRLAGRIDRSAAQSRNQRGRRE